LAGIVTGTPAKEGIWKATYQISDGNVYTYKSFEDIKGNPDIDVIYIVLPPSMHMEYVVKAAKTGKQV
jgi:glucose-fructose oxidoreductase